MDVNIKDLDDHVARRLKEQATAGGLSMQQYLRIELARIAARPSPAEFSGRSAPMSREEFIAVRDRLRAVDGA